MQISGMQIDRGSDILNLNTLVVILMQEFDTAPHIELRRLLNGMKLILSQAR